jgi:CBS domain containing-hemolysin-like protein
MGIELDFLLFSISVLVLGLFSGACTALEILSISKLDRTAEHYNRFVVRLLDDPLYTGLAIGIARALAVALTVITSIRLAHDFIFEHSENGLILTGLFVVVALLVPILISRLLVLQGAERFLAAAGFVAYPVALAIKPVAMLLGGLLKRLSPALLNLLSFQMLPLKDKIDMFGAQNGEETDEEQRLVSSVLDFGETKVREVMVPRIDIVAVNVSMNLDEALQVVMDAGHSRIPVFDDTIDRIVGTLYTKDLLRKIIDEEDYSLEDIAREPFFVPESKMIDDLLAEFKIRKQHLAVVVDEYGGTAGIVTLEDVLEEIVGDIQDEFDAEEALIERIDDDSALCNAKIHLEELNENLGTELPEDGPESLGGLLYQEIGRVPRVGDKHQMDSLTFDIKSVERQRIDKVLITGLSSLPGGVENGAG